MTLLTIMLYAGIGLALGRAHFYGLRRDTRNYLHRGPSLGAVAIHAARVIATAAAFVFIARRGALPLLGALAGFMIAKFVAVAQARAAS